MAASFRTWTRLGEAARPRQPSMSIIARQGWLCKPAADVNADCRQGGFLGEFPAPFKTLRIAAVMRFGKLHEKLQRPVTFAEAALIVRQSGVSTAVDPSLSMPRFRALIVLWQGKAADG